MDSGLEAWLAHASDFQRDPNQAYFHLGYLLGNRANGTCWCYQHLSGSVSTRYFGYWPLWMTSPTWTTSPHISFLPLHRVVQ